MPSLRTGLTIVACSATVVLGGLVAPAPASAAPQVGACYSYKTAVLTEASTPAPPVGCATQHTADPRRACAPVAGVVSQVAVQVGEHVSAGQPLVCVEAMKMEMWLHAGAPGRVVAVHAVARASVAAGAVLVELEIEP